MTEGNNVFPITGSLSGKENENLTFQETSSSGSLTDNELKIWKNFTNQQSNFICPICDKNKRHIICDTQNIVGRIIFESIRKQHSKGFIILEQDNKKWYIADTGIKVDDIYFFKRDGFIFAFNPATENSPGKIQQGKITIANKTFYIS